MKNLCTAMAAAFPEIEGATKDSTNPHFKSKYADLTSVVEAIKPAITKHGLFFSQICHEAPNGVCVETVVSHSSGEQMSFGKLFVPAAKLDPQGFGSALTYARRYSLMTAFGVAPEDDDGNAAAKGGSAGAAKIDDAQYAVLITMLQNTGANTTTFLESFQIRQVQDLPASKFQQAVDRINEYHKRKLEKAAQSGKLKDQLEDSVKEAA